MTKEERFKELFEAFRHDVLYLTNLFSKEWKVEFRDLLINWLKKDYLKESEND